MFDFTVDLSQVTHAIQLALAPVFLLTGIAGILNVMAGRLARIIDRGRHIEEGSMQPEYLARESVVLEAQNLDARRHLASTAIAACTFSALLVCMVIVALFMEVLLGLQLKYLAGVLFTCATLALVIGLAYFLREVHLATKTIRISVFRPSDPQT